MLMWHAWHGAAFERAKTLPPLKDLLKRPEKKQAANDQEGHDQMSINLMNALMNMRPKGRRSRPASNEEPATAAG